MATRMQQRRGTAAQWTSANPILNAGEMGWESDTNKFKIGDGTNHWADLDYFIDQSSTVNPSFGSSITFEGSTADAYETTLTVTDPTADRTITLPNSSGTVVLADGSGNVTVSGNLTVNGTTTSVDSTTINVTNAFVFEGSTANDYETTLSIVEPTADRTIYLKDASGTLAFTSDVDYTAGLINASIDTINGTLGNKQDKVTGISDTEIGYLDGVTSNIQTQLTAKLDSTTASTTYAPIANPTFTGQVALPTTLVFEGATADAYETSLTVTDPTADRTITLPNASGTVVLADSSQTLTNKTITSADNTVTITASAVSDFTEAAQDAIGNSVGTGLSYNDSTGVVSVDTTAIQARVADVSDTEIGYLNGVTSAIQTQIDAKASTSHTHSQSDITNLTTDLAAKASLSGATFTGAVTLAADPSSALHAATKQYVDAATAGLNVHQSVRAATTANITLSSAVENGDTLDGVTLATGNRILVKNQTTKSENGVYIVAASGAPTRATDYDSTPEVDAGDFIFVEEGTTNAKTGWVQTNVITTIGTDNIEFSQFSGTGLITAGTNISVSGNQISVISNPTFSGLVTASASGVAFSDGTQTKEAVPSRTTIVQKTDSYTLSSLTERDNLIEMGKATAQTVTIPTNATVAYPVGTSIDILQTGAGQVTIAGAVGVTVNATPGLKLRAQWSSATLFKRATDTWVVMGDLSA